MLLLVLPAASVILESTISAHGASIMGLIGKWYVFWAGGVRLLLAGLRQVSQPRFTASDLRSRQCQGLSDRAGNWIREPRDGNARDLHDLPRRMVGSCRYGCLPLLRARRVGPPAAGRTKRPGNRGDGVGRVCFPRVADCSNQWPEVRNSRSPLAVCASVTCRVPCIATFGHPSLPTRRGAP
jgi:hypothetical protein